MVAWLTLAAGLLVTVLLWRLVHLEVREAALRDFRIQADELVEAVSQRMLAYQQVLQGGLGLFTATGHPSRTQWRDYVAALRIQDQYPGIQGIGFSLRLHPDELASHVAQVRAEGFPDYSVKPEGERAEYTAIIYLEPFDMRNRRAFGYDMFSQPTRREAMEKARDSGEPRLSGKVILKQEMTEDVQAGFLLYVPLYRTGTGTGTVDQRREALVGYVYSPFRAGDLMRGILGAETPRLNLQIYDGLQATPAALMYDEHAPAGESGAAPRYSDTRMLEIQGRPWTLAISSTPAFEDGIDEAKPRILAFSGVLISLLIFALVWQLSTRRERALALAGAMTARVREREGFINALVDNAADGIITIDRQGTILTFNRAAQAIFGYSSDEVVGRNVSLLMPEPHRSHHDDYIRRFLRTGERRIIGVGREVTGMRKDGTGFPLDLAVSAVQQEEGLVFTGIVRDITERKRVEQLKNEFISTVSHELRTPLTSIRGSLGLVAGGAAGPLSRQAEELMEIAARNSDHLLRLINDLLDIEKLQSGNLDFQCGPQPVAELVQRAIEANQGYAAEYGVRFRMSLPDRELNIHVDPSRFLQVMHNLLSNAAKFSPPGGEVRVEVSEAGGCARVAVTDEGPGIAEAFRERVFDRFSQADGSDSRHQGGTGLGLNISRSLVEHMQGHIGFDSVPGRGATFYVLFPLCRFQQRQARA